MDGRISDLLSRRNELVKIVVADYKPKIAAVCHLLKSSEKVDEQELERFFDGMVDHCYDNEMVELFNQLCQAAEVRFPQLVQDYIRFYKEL